LVREYEKFDRSLSVSQKNSQAIFSHF